MNWSLMLVETILARFFSIPGASGTIAADPLAVVFDGGPAAGPTAAGWIATSAGSDCGGGMRGFHGSAEKSQIDGCAEGRKCGNCGKSRTSCARCAEKC